MRVRVRLFASLREVAGEGELDLEVAAGATIEDVWRALVAARPLLEGKRHALAAAVDRRLVAFGEHVACGSEIAFLPPVSGG
jgi:molybdopterin converting factor small subunit